MASISLGDNGDRTPGPVTTGDQRARQFDKGDRRTPHVPFVDVANIIEYGLTQKLSRVIRVF